MKHEPSYSVTSVDRALVLLHLIRDQGVVTVTEAALALGASPSTAHRLLTMLVYRDFATQDESRRYVAGPALGIPNGPGGGVAVLRRVLQPVLERLVGQIGETVNLSVRVGAQIRIVAAAETRTPLHVGNQLGSVLPAHLTSGGLAELAALERADALRVFTDVLDAQALRTLDGRLRQVRSAGYAVNPGRAEAGVHGIGVGVRSADGAVVAAVSAAMPSMRFRREDVPRTAALLAAAVAEAAPRIRPV